MTVVIGLLLGCAAFVPDLMTEEAAPYATPLVSSGFAWGLTALIAGSRFQRPKSAALAGAGVLMLATVTYYGLILLVDRRWEADPTAHAGLWSLARGTALWLAGSACGGVIMGVIGSLIQNARPRPASAACGLATGFLAGEGIFTLIRVQSIWIAHLTPFELSRFAPAAAQLVLTAAAVALLIRQRREGIHPPTLLAAALPSLAANVLVWYGVETARTVLY